MGFDLLGHHFDGYFSSTEQLEDRSGIYIVVYESGGKYYVLDVGESATVRSRVETHDRKDCWERNRNGPIAYAVCYTPNLQQQGRMEVEQAIRNHYSSIPCGNR